MKTAQHFIANQWINEGALGESLNPANGAVLGTYHFGSATLLEQAAVEARSIFFKTAWATSPRLRATALFELADRLEAAKPELIGLIIAENGKLQGEATGEVTAAVSETRYYAGLTRTILGRTQETGPGNFSLMLKEPAGVVGIIVPWNAPVTLLLRSLAPALAAGCTAVIKPAAQTPLVHARVMQCIAECPTIPAGVVNSVNENGFAVGQAMTTSPNIDVISFTGSSATGKLIMAGAAPTLKRVNLELGGKAPAVIFADADLDLVVKELTHGALAMAGQICVSAARFIVEKSIQSEFEKRIIASFKSVRIGPGSDPASQMGPLIDTANQNRLLGLINQAEDEGEMLLRGKASNEGAYLSPSLFRIKNLQSSLIQDELFGPIVSVETFEDEAEAVHMANATVYGLAASLFTKDLNRSMRVSRAIRAGTVWLNSHMRLFAEAETGGYGQSGLGRLHGIEGLNDFLETKHVYLEAGNAKPGTFGQ